MNPLYHKDPTGKLLPAIFCLTLLLILVSFLTVIYISGIKNQGELLYNYDARFWYVGGTMMLSGVSPFDKRAFHENWEQQFGEPPLFGGAFVYPPTIAIVCVPTALLPWAAACWALRIASFLAFIGTCYFTVRLVWPNRPLKQLGLETGFFVITCGLLGSVTQTMIQGQPVMIVVWGLAAMLYGWRRDNLPLFIIGFVIATIKPQLSLLPILFIAFAGGYRKLGVAVLVAVGVSIAALLFSPFDNLPRLVIGSIQEHMAVEHNKAVGYDSLPALLGATAYGRLLIYGGLLIGSALAAWLGRQCRQSTTTLFSAIFIRRWQVALALVPAWMPLHRYDFVIHVPLVASLAVIPGWWRKGGVLVLILLHERLYKVTSFVEQLTDDSVMNMFHLSSMMSGLLLLFLVGFYISDLRNGHFIAEG